MRHEGSNSGLNTCKLARNSNVATEATIAKLGANFELFVTLIEAGTCILIPLLG
jgi:hypothetical protein